MNKEYDNMHFNYIIFVPPDTRETGRIYSVSEFRDPKIICCINVDSTPWDLHIGDHIYDAVVDMVSCSSSCTLRAKNYATNYTNCNDDNRFGTFPKFKSPLTELAVITSPFCKYTYDIPYISTLRNLLLVPYGASQVKHIHNPQLHILKIGESKMAPEGIHDISDMKDLFALDIMSIYFDSFDEIARIDFPWGHLPLRMLVIDVSRFNNLNSLPRTLEYLEVHNKIHDISEICHLKLIVIYLCTTDRDYVLHCVESIDRSRLKYVVCELSDIDLQDLSDEYYPVKFINKCDVNEAAKSGILEQIYYKYVR